VRKATKFGILLSVFIVLGSFYSYSQSNEKKFVVFLVNKIDLEDIEDMAFTKALAEKYGIGLMNTRASGSSNDYSSTLTIGCGTRAEANFYTSRSVELDDGNRSIYQRRTGYEDRYKEIANLDIARLRDLNSRNNFNPIVGALGNSLGLNGNGISVLGNSDTDERKVRLGVLMGMDEYGLVDYGVVDDTNVKTLNYPFGLATDYELMIQGFKESLEKSDIIILELGDLYRLEKYSSNLTSDMYEKHKTKVLSDIDAFIKKVYGLLDKENTRVLLLSPTPSSTASSSGKKLTPIILAGSGIDEGVISSDTTRREGIIGNIDIAPYIAVYFGSNTNYFTGKPLYILGKQDKLSYMKELYNDTAFVYKNRMSVLFTFAVYEIIVSFIAFIVIQLSGKHRLRFYRVFEYFLLSNMAIPAALLILPLWKSASIFNVFIKIIIITIVMIFISISIRKEPMDSIIFLSGLTCLLLTTDIILNSRLIKMSFLGYDPIIGARYYGVGNEFMGILVGSSLVFTMALLDRYKINKNFSIMIFAIIAFVIGFPKLGANVGGTITAVFAFMFVILRLYNSKLKLTHYFYIIASICVCIALIALADLYLLESNSHLANAIKQINNGGVNAIFSIIKRKVSMNIKVFSVTIWSKVLITSLIFLSILFYRPFGIAKKIFDKYQNLSIGLLGILISCIVAFLVNDSGVIASATSIIFLAISLMYLIFIEVVRS
jgi:hypothetical protein